MKEDIPVQRKLNTRLIKNIFKADFKVKSKFDEACEKLKGNSKRYNFSDLGS